MKRLIGKGLATLAVMTVCGVPAVRAGLLPVSATTTPGTDGGPTRFTYGVVLTTDAFIQAGDYFTIYDFAGLVAGSTSQPDGWVLVPGGLTPNNVNPHDDAGLPNLTWKFVGPGTITGQVGLGDFSAESSSVGSMYNSFTALSHRVSDGHADTNITDTLVPSGGTTGAPEPATLALMGIGLPLAGVLRFLRRRRRD